MIRKFVYILAMALASQNYVQAGDIWVSPQGNDNNNGI